MALDAVLKKREQVLQARRKRSAPHRRVWRRYLREPFWDLKTSLFARRTGMQQQRLLDKTVTMATTSICDRRFLKHNVMKTVIVGSEVRPCDAVQSDRSIPMFRKNGLPPSSRQVEW
jgi:hypothetical protein